MLRKERGKTEKLSELTENTSAHLGDRLSVLIGQFPLLCYGLNLSHRFATFLAYLESMK